MKRRKRLMSRVKPMPNSVARILLKQLEHLAQTCPHCEKPIGNYRNAIMERWMMLHLKTRRAREG